MLQVRRINTILPKEKMVKAYIGVVLAVKDIQLTPSEIEFLSFCICGGGRITWEIRQKFCETNKISKNSLYNLQHSLKNKGFLAGGEVLKELMIDPTQGIGIMVRIDAQEDREDIK